MPTQHKSRNTVDWIGQYKHARYSGYVPLYDLTDQLILGGTGEVDTTGNPYWLLGTGRDIGSTFSARSCKWSNQPAHVVLNTQDGPHDGTWYELDTPVSAWYSNRSGPPSGYGIPASLSENSMIAYGVQGISRTIPTNPLSGLGVFLGELRELPRAFDLNDWKIKLKDMRKLSKRASDDYLNLQFGWLPLINDIKKFINVTVKYDRIAKHLSDNSGKNVHRRVNLLNDTTTTNSRISNSAYGSPVLPTEAVVQTGKVDVSVKETTNVWFSGSYTYYLPGDPRSKVAMESHQSRSSRIRQIAYGSRVDADTLYNLAPWSWALDWITNTGDILHIWNAFTQDELVLRYGYVMCHKIREVTYTLSALKLLGGQTVSATQTCLLESKQRSRATPYGFGLSPTGFSPKQWSIIAALGISRAPYSLNS